MWDRYFRGYLSKKTAYKQKTVEGHWKVCMKLPQGSFWTTAWFSVVFKLLVWEAAI